MGLQAGRCRRWQARARSFVTRQRDVYDVRIIRKQLYIGEEHERALKQRARELGVSEAELVRRLLDGLVSEGGGGALAGVGATVALEDFFAESDRISEEHRLPEAYRFERDDLYEDRGGSSDGAPGG